MRGRMVQWSHMKRTEIVVLIIVMAVAVGFRLVGLSWAPPGLSPEEAMNGNNALQALHSGEYKMFYAENSSREGLFINLQAASVASLGNTPQALRVVSALAGILTVLGVYLLTRRMFDDWRLAAVAAYLMATGFWHVLFSHIGLAVILAPLCAVWGFYFLYRGIETHHLWHWALAGLFFGLGFHAYFVFRVIPLAVALTLVAFWLSLRSVFSHGKFFNTRHQMLGGAAMLVGVMILVFLPMASYFYANPQHFTDHASDLSIGKTLGMFFFRGDGNWGHNIAGQPVLFWPVAALFAVGLLRTLWRFMQSWRMRGHPGIVQTLLLSWFCVGLIPAMRSSESSPDSLLALVVAPAVYIMAAVGLHWVFVSLDRWYFRSDEERGALIVSATLIIFLCALGVAQASRYFVEWAKNPIVAQIYAVQSVAAAGKLNSLPPSTLKYVVVSASAQTVMFLTDTWMPQQQKERYIYYITQQQFDKKQYPKGAFIIRLDP